MNNLQRYVVKQNLVIKLAESHALKDLKGDESKYTGSRALTSLIPGVAATGAVGALAVGQMAGCKGALLGGFLGGLYGGANKSYGRILQASATRGRAAAGEKGTTESEQQVIDALRASGDKSGTNPISRALTSTGVASGVGAGYGAMQGARLGGGAKAALIGALIGGGTGYAGNRISRAIGARAQKGRAEMGGAGNIGGSEAAITKAIQQAKA